MAHDVNWIRCVINKEAYPTKENHRNVQCAVKTVNFVEARLLSNRLFFVMKRAVNIRNFCFVLTFAGFPGKRPDAGI